MQCSCTRKKHRKRVMDKASVEQGPAQHGRDVVLIVFLAAILFLPSVLSRNLWNPDALRSRQRLSGSRQLPRPETGSIAYGLSTHAQNLPPAAWL